MKFDGDGKHSYGKHFYELCKEWLGKRWDSDVISTRRYEDWSLDRIISYLTI